jgi:hypothetical protein
MGPMLHWNLIFLCGTSIIEPSRPIVGADGCELALARLECCKDFSQSVAAFQSNPSQLQAVGPDGWLARVLRMQCGWGLTELPLGHCHRLSSLLAFAIDVHKISHLHYGVNCVELWTRIKKFDLSYWSGISDNRDSYIASDHLGFAMSITTFPVLSNWISNLVEFIDFIDTCSECIEMYQRDLLKFKLLAHIPTKYWSMMLGLFIHSHCCS